MAVYPIRLWILVNIESLHENNLMRQIICLSGLFLVFSCGGQSQEKKSDRPVGGPCEGCEVALVGMPANVGWDERIGPVGEPGQPLVMEGVIYKKDGKTPADGVILYLYHTNSAGLYVPAAGQTGMVARHGHIRGWVKTGKDGRYRFTTIRPATYPNTTFAAHIHPTIKEPGLQAYYIDEYVFADDPFIKGDYDKKQEKRGGSGVVKLQKDASGTWHGKRDIILGLNVPGY